MNEDEKRAALLELIEALCVPDFSKNEKLIAYWYRRLLEIYSHGYRHSYSDLFYKLQDILLKDSEVSEVLGENLNVLEEYIKSAQKENKNDANLQSTVECYKKFADHIRLEIGRYNFIKLHFEKRGEQSIQTIEAKNQYVSELNRISSDVDKIRPIVTQAKKSLDDLDSKLENNKISSITTLTIFSAVVLAFSGGFTFEVGMLQEMQFATSYRLVFTISLTGFVLFNTIFVLLYLVGKMAGKTISTRCKYISINEKNEKVCKKCGDGYCIRKYNEVSIICRLFHKYSYVAFINIILMWIMYIDFILWFYKPSRLDFYIILVMLLPTLLIVFGGLVMNIQRQKQKQRNILFYRLELVNRVLYPQKTSSFLIDALCTMGDFIKKITGCVEKDIVEEYNDLINTCDLDVEKQYKQIIQLTDNFIEERITNGSEDIKYISKEENKYNKKKWKLVNKKFNDYLLQNIHKK